MSNDELVLELGQHHDSGAARRALLPRVVGGRLGGGLVGRGGAAHLSSDKLSRYFIRICPNFTLVWSGAASLAQLFEQSYNIWTFGHVGGCLISKTEGGNLASKYVKIRNILLICFILSEQSEKCKFILVYWS